MSSPESDKELPKIVQASLEDQGLSFTPDGRYVRWASTNPKHPRNWSGARKAYDITLIMILEFYTTAVSTSGATAAKDAQHHYHLGLVLSIFLYVSTYSLVQGVGNIIFPPYSEMFGRKMLYIASTALYSAFCVIIAAINSPAAAVVGRIVTGFLSAIPSVVVTGSVEDMFNARERVWMVFVYMVISNLGVAMGPVMSAYITATLGWRWVFYIAAIVTGAITFMLLAIRESRPSLLLVREVEKLRKETGDPTLEGLNPDGAPSLHTFVRTSLFRPVQLLCTEPIVFACAMMSGTCVGLIYLFTEALPPIFESTGMNEQQANLPFIALAVGFIPSILIRLIDRWIASQRKRDGDPVLPEQKLTGIAIGAPCLAIGLWWFGWTIPPIVNGVHWFVPVVSLLFIGFAYNEFGIVLAGYLADSYNSYSASAYASLATVRSLLSAMFPLFADKMFGTLGANAGMSVLAAVATLFCIVPFLFRSYGQKMREKSKFAKFSLQVSAESGVDSDGY